MNKLDGSFYKALRFLADNTRAEIKVMEEQKLTLYDDNVPKDVEATLKEFDYIRPYGTTKFIISQKGLQQLRDLELIKHRDLTLILSVIALVISIISFATVNGWVK
ncbi:TPA: hypothetical protein HA281_04565 [Candidatus Woesearchaeota archaeon]|nr:hypothetical protein [Candidatus Woesearchaeota archaeon]HIH04665.1 hypothetical protein [Candidatus Woesearchaeota archaeon]HIH92052.1 hypothetical protein [Candidatus Woesearchaeota archaeon]HIJ18375.1 hypothetical protein [Candidatus Woesearchaeota archaeon]